MIHEAQSRADSMLLRELGRSGVRIPELGLGTHDYHSGPGPLQRGLESGALFIDTAESYGTEAVVGEAVRGVRNRVFIATKVSPEHYRARDLRASADGSLIRLGVDTIDLLQLHHPNPAIPISETMDALSSLIDAGKVRFCGVSNFSVAELRDAQNACGRHPIVSNQVRYNLLDRSIEENGLLEYCQQSGVAVIAYSPLARSVSRILDCDALGIISRIARETGKTPAQIAINWCLCKDGILAIPKGSSTGHILDNCGASDWRLTPEQIDLLDTSVHYRRHNRFDRLTRQWMPGPLQRMAVQVSSFLPRSVRRRFT